MLLDYYIGKVREFVTDPVYRIRYLSRKGLFKDDEKYIKMIYRRMFDKEMDLDNPKTFNEKNNWRKLYDRRPIYTEMVDKYLCKKIVEEKVGKGYTFPLLGVWDKPEQIDFNYLPKKFVLKSNHGGVL